MGPTWWGYNRIRRGGFRSLGISRSSPSEATYISLSSYTWSLCNFSLTLSWLPFVSSQHCLRPVYTHPSTILSTSPMQDVNNIHHTTMSYMRTKNICLFTSISTSPFPYCQIDLPQSNPSEPPIGRTSDWAKRLRDSWTEVLSVNREVGKRPTLKKVHIRSVEGVEYELVGTLGRWRASATERSLATP